MDRVLSTITPDCTANQTLSQESQQSPRDRQSNVVSVQDMKPWGSGDTKPLILYLGDRRMCVITFTLRLL